MARRIAKGLSPVAPKDAEAFRILPKDAGPHFTRYTDELLQLTSAPLLLELRLFPNAKELSESFACFAAVRAHLAGRFDPQDPSVTVVCIGDGSRPRTAALFAFRTAWRCVSVDPLLEERTVGPDGPRWEEVVCRLEVWRSRVEDVPAVSAERTLMVLPHAHVGLTACFAKVSWRYALGVVAMPCCNFYRALSLPSCSPIVEQEDAAVVSPHRLMRVWAWSRGDALPDGVPPPMDDP